MENLHAPTVPSGPTTTSIGNGTYANGQSLGQLQAKKDNIEAEIKALSSVLDSVRAILCSVSETVLMFNSMGLTWTLDSSLQMASLEQILTWRKVCSSISSLL